MSLSVLERLHLHGVSVFDISQRFGVSERSIYYSLNSESTGSRRVRLYISSVLSTPPSLLFPDLSADSKFIDDSFFMSSLVASYMPQSSIFMASQSFNNEKNLGISV